MTVQFYQGKDHFEDAYAVREAVFMHEQGFSSEIDEKDDACTHCVIYDQGLPVACGRFFFEQPHVATIGRIAVLKSYRGMHLGQKVMQEIEQEAVKQGAVCCSLSAQCQASDFYRKLGYEAQGETYLDEHCPHIHMKKKM